MSNVVSSYVLIVIFGGFTIWIGYGWLKTHKQVQIRDKFWTFSRVVFLITGILLVGTVFIYNGILDMIRFGVMLLCIIVYLLQKDGMGEQGIVITGKFYPWHLVKAYDFQEKKNSFMVYYSLMEGEGSKREEYLVTTKFDKKNEEEVQKMLKDHIGKKYKRMRKD